MSHFKTKSRSQGQHGAMISALDIFGGKGFNFRPAALVLLWKSNLPLFPQAVNGQLAVGSG